MFLCTEAVLNVPYILEIFRLRCCFNKCTCQASNQHHGQKHLKERCHQQKHIILSSMQPLCKIVLLPKAHSAKASIAAMDASLVHQVLEAMNESIPINLKWTRVRTMLANHGLCWNSKEKVEAFCCHPSNRGGVMLSPHDCHACGSAIISLGADMAKIQTSVAFEISPEPLQKAKQLQANRDLVSASQGKLANISGQERFLTCGSSHLTAFCRAVQAQCSTEDEWLSTLSNGHLSLDAIVAHGQDHVFRDMVTDGWTWTIISHSVEKAIPELPVLIQQALNTVGAATTLQPNETEVLQTVSHLYQMAANAGNKPNLKACLEQVATTKPKCLPYLDTIGYYLTKYGGGAKFPTITMLQHIGRFDFVLTETS